MQNTTSPRFVRVKIIEWQQQAGLSHSLRKRQGGPICVIDLERLSPRARILAEACAKCGVTRFFDRAAIQALSIRRMGDNWTAKQREVYGEEMANEQIRVNVLLAMRRRDDRINNEFRVNPYEYFEQEADRWKNIDWATVEPAEEVAPGVFRAL